MEWPLRNLDDPEGALLSSGETKKTVQLHEVEKLVKAIRLTEVYRSPHFFEPSSFEFFLNEASFQKCETQLAN